MNKDNLSKLVDALEIDFEPFNLLSYEEKQAHINKLSMYHKTKEQLLNGYSFAKRVLDFHYEASYGILRAKLFNVINTNGKLTQEQEEKFIEIRKKLETSYEQKKDELLEVVNSVKTINQWE